MELFSKLQHNAIEYHLTVLNELKSYFNYIKRLDGQNEQEDFNMSSFFENLFDIKKKTLKLYTKIIDLYPDEKV